MNTQNESPAELEQIIRRRGLGSPKEFHCPKCRSRVVKPTGNTRPYTPSEGSALGTRGNLVAAEYLCACGHNGWTNHNDLVKENKMRGARVYFYDSDRPKGAKEISESDANQGRFVGFSTRENDNVGGVIIEGPQGERVITRADFPTATGTVRAKLWMPGKEAEWVTLVEQGLVSTDVPAPNVDKFSKVPETMTASGPLPTKPVEGVEISKRVENICAELARLGIDEKLLAPILAEVRPF